jgi:adenosylhomocysteinase
VARLHLGKVGVELTGLTDEQATYIGVPKRGPYRCLPAGAATK